MNTLSAIAGWVEAHPTLFVLVIWPFLFGVFTYFFKPRTAEEYAASARRNPVWFFSRWTAFRQLLGTLGIDPRKAAEIFVGKVLLGRVQPPPPPRGPSMKETILPSDALMKRALKSPSQLSLAGWWRTSFNGSPWTGAALACAAVMLTGCGWLQKHGDTLTEIATDKAQCALGNMNLPIDVIIKRCFLRPEDVPKILPLLGTAREEAAREAAGARADERARLIGAGACDAGAP